MFDNFDAQIKRSTHFFYKMLLPPVVAVASTRNTDSQYFTKKKRTASRTTRSSLANLLEERDAEEVQEALLSLRQDDLTCGIFQKEL